MALQNRMKVMWQLNFWNLRKNRTKCTGNNKQLHGTSLLFILLLFFSIFGLAREWFGLSSFFLVGFPNNFCIRGPCLKGGCYLERGFSDQKGLENILGVGYLLTRDVMCTLHHNNTWNTLLPEFWGNMWSKIWRQINHPHDFLIWTWNRRRMAFENQGSGRKGREF